MTAPDLAPPGSVPGRDARAVPGAATPPDAGAEPARPTASPATGDGRVAATGCAAGPPGPAAAPPAPAALAAPAPAPPALAAAGLVAGYRRRRRRTPVVSIDRLEAAAGELTAVVGPNGAGKSTLLRTLVGAQPALAGTVEVGGRRLDRLDRRARARHLAVVLTDRVDPGLLTVGDVVALGRHPHTGWTGHLSAEDTAAARAAAELVEVGGLWARPFAELSDGQRQRVLVARALAQEPRLIVLDEPTAFLDLPGRAGLTATLRRLTRRSGVAAVVSTHDLDLALGHADRLWVVHDGGLVAGAPEDLLADGTLARAFAHDGLTLDPVTGLMRPPPAEHPLVAMSGVGMARALAERTAARCGVRVVGAERGASASWLLEVDDAGWRLRTRPGASHEPHEPGRPGGPGAPGAPGEQRGTTHAELARALRLLGPSP